MGYRNEPLSKEGYATDVLTAEESTIQVPGDNELHRALKARHITMIAIGGAIGTGLVIGTGSALAKAGPASILISYSIVGLVVYMVMCGLGEMAAWLPLPSGFTGYAVRFCDPALGFAMGYTYWFKYIIVTPNQLTAGALVISYWVDKERVNPGVWITIFLVLIVSINYFGVRFFGEFEFWLSSFKVIVILGLILLSFILMLGGGPDHDRKGFRYWKNPGAFNTYIDDGAAGRFYAFWATMVSATFAYLGTELVGVTVGEAENPRKTIPKAIKLTFYRIVVFYILSVLLVGTLVPYDSEELIFATTQSSSAAASPFVVAIVLAGIPVLPHILNACILLFVFSAANSDLYIATRTIYGLARENKAPQFLAKTDRRGVPIYALGLCAAIACIAYMNVSSDSKVVFGYFVDLVTIFGLLTWVSLLITHIYFVRARRAQNVPLTDLAYRAPFGVWGSYAALVFCVLICLTKSFDVFTHNKKWGNFNYKTFITAYLGIPLYLCLIGGYKLVTRCSGVDPYQADLWTGKDVVDAEERAYLRRRAAMEERHQGANWFYRKFVAWLF
ncbi:dicarboxylic amino acid permease agtA [Aspergillus homomorphus CBS 101889]|uniref:Amino acid permease n=1 Tax=Aspergillus homomorphus (strain CBS 101889) TaxID=1450537 RepID=A0A395I5T5_ASPHC|nr:amino acid permease [Aspergillus homomorphus CBS 101889]RAL15155.1 amino acid permease [Aspergillus homomorphus CBS 101889]